MSAKQRKWVDYCFVVFYMGRCKDRKASNSHYDNRISYLKRTVANAFKHTNRVGIFVCNDHDQEVVRENLQGVECTQLVCPTTMHLPCEACIYVQNNMHTLGLDDNDIVYFTEADHMMYVDDGFLDRLVTTIRSNKVYASMHRIEQLYNGNGRERGINIRLFDLDFVLPNTDPNLENLQPCDSDGLFYQSRRYDEAYAGAHIMTARTFKQVRFVNDGVLENASFSCFYSIPCIKTRKITDFYLVHFSGYEYHASFSGVYNACASLCNGE